MELPHSTHREKKTSLTQKIMLAFLLPITAGIFVTLAVFFVSTKNEKTNEVQNMTSLLNENMLATIDGFKKEVELLATMPQIISFNHELAEPYLNGFMNKSSGVWSHFLITNETGFNIAHTDGQKSRGVSIADRSYFTVPWKDSKTEIAEPTFSKSTGRRILAIGTPIYNNGVKTGVLVGFVRLEYISKILNDFKITKNSFIFMLDKNGLLIAHPNPDIVLLQNWLKPDKADAASTKYVAAMSTSSKKVITDITSGNSGTALVKFEKKLSFMSYERTGLGTISIVSVSPFSEIFSIFIIICYALAAIFAILFVISLFFGKSIVRPLLKITQALPAIAEGDFTLSLAVSGSDESAQLAHYFNQTIGKIRNSVQSVKDETDIMKKIGTELTKNASQSAAAVKLITAAIENSKLQVVNESAGVTETQATIEQIIKNIEKLNHNIAKQSESIADSTAATEQMVANIRSVFDILERNTKEVANLSDAAQQGRESLAKSATITEKIASESDGLLEASSIIENIASQTNLLAMNAAIEAAHAGDAGKGFAVVADEIRKLAENSSSQSKSITQVLNKLKNDIEQLTQSSDYVQQQFTSIFDLTQSVQNQGQTVNNMMQEQAEANDQVLKSMQLISEITGGVQHESAQMLQGSKEIGVEMQKIAEITELLNNSMSEMATKTNEIDQGAQSLNTMAQQASESIDKVTQTVGVFKV